MTRKNLDLWSVGCHSSADISGSKQCNRLPEFFVRGPDGVVQPKCDWHYDQPYYEVVAKIKWTKAVKKMRCEV